MLCVIPAVANADDVTDWSGVYFGVHAGFASIDTDITTDLDGSWNANPQDRIDRQALLPLLNDDLDENAWTGGISAGYDFKFNTLVVGAVADISFLDSSENSTSFTSGPAQSFRVDSSSKVENMATLRARVGYAFGRSLLYATGGVAYAEHSFTQRITQLDLPVLGFSQTASFKEGVIGVVWGGGFEHNLWGRWSLSGQYLHADFGIYERVERGHLQPWYRWMSDVYWKSQGGPDIGLL